MEMEMELLVGMWNLSATHDISGARCRVHRDDALYQATEDQQGLCVATSPLPPYIYLYASPVSSLI
jgi:hypothetical protein